MRNDVQIMITGYVIPAILLTLVLSGVILLAGTALDREAGMQDQVVNQYRGE